MRRAILTLLVLFCWSSVLVGQELVDQRTISKNSCGACCIVHTLGSGEHAELPDVSLLPGQDLANKADLLHQLYGGKPSETYENQTRYTDERGGVSGQDLTLTFNEILEKFDSELRMKGGYLDRRTDEALTEHLHRIHSLFSQSIESGVPVILSVRSFATKFNETKGAFLWEGLHNHFVTVDHVQATIRENEKGFQFSFLDSGSGKKEYGYIYFDEARNFNAVKGDSVTWEWKPDRAFLCVTAPSLRLKTQQQAFHSRTVITLNYAIGPAVVFETHIEESNK